MATSRERQMKFIRIFGRYALEVGASEMLCKFGPDWLTDEQIADITADRVESARRMSRQQVRNRAIQKARQ
jgi:hypothetical protein